MNKFELWLQNNYQLSLQTFGIFAIMSVIAVYLLVHYQVGYGFLIMFGAGGCDGRI